MSELLTKIQCPHGCQNAIFTETTKFIRHNSNLLLESDPNPIKVKVYTCRCCGSTFEMQENKGRDSKLLI